MERPMEKLTFGNLLTRLGGETLSFPHPVEKIEIVQTHISIVLLTENFAYKVKKPVNFPFVNYSTLEKRRDFCQLEVELNRRLAPDVYLGVVPLTRIGNRLAVEGGGEIVEYAVKMRRLPNNRRLNRLLENKSLPENFWTLLASRLNRFYQNAPQGPKVSKWAEPLAVAEDWRQILDQIALFPPQLLDPSLRMRLEALSKETFDQKKRRISLRTKAARDGHGDLRLEHIYYFPDKPEPNDISVIDCVEFNPRYRCGDPLCDTAFLAMDLESAGYKDQALLFTREFLKMSGETTDHLGDFYTAYRHLVRGLIRGLQAQDLEESPDDRSAAREKAHRHFLQALGKMEQPAKKPCLVLLGGLPGTGKSSLAKPLAEREGFLVFSSDAVRKELTDQPFESHPGTAYEKGIYKPEWTEKTYDTLLLRAGEALRQGKRVLVDASFSRENWRERFENLAKSRGIPFLFFVCIINHETAGKRLSENRHFGSDADMDIYHKMAGRWDPPTPDLGTMFLNTERAPRVNLAEIHQTLAQMGLAENAPLPIVK